MTIRKLAMTILVTIIVLELAYYLIYLKAPNEPTLTMELLNNEVKIQELFEKEYEDFQYGEERRTTFKYIMGVTIIGGFILASFMPNRKL